MMLFSIIPGFDDLINWLTDHIESVLSAIKDAIVTWLGKILCVLVALNEYILRGIVDGINAILGGMGDAAVYMVENWLPSMPDPPSWGDLPTQIFGIVNWIFPFGTLVSIIGTMLTFYLLWQFVSIFLRWFKAI